MFAIIAGWAGLLLGGWLFGFWGAIIGMVGGVIASFINFGTTETAPTVYKEATPQKDAQQKQTMPNRLISFNYLDAGGEASKRTVDVERIYEYSGRVYLDGFCKLRGDTRTFRVGRITGKIFIHATNEQISPERYCLENGIEPPHEQAEAPYTPPSQHWGDGSYVKIAATLGIEGTDISGRLKRITLIISEYNGSSWLDGLCEGSQQRETFLVENINCCVDMSTGAVIDDIPQFLLEKYQESPEYMLKKALEKLSDILSVLFYVGKADGQLRAEERTILRAVVRKIAKHEQITDEMIDRQLKGLQTPSLQAVKLAINRICKSSGHNMATTYKIAQQIVATQKSVHPSETEILEYMQRKMAKEGIAP